jgi:putative nucleotidyltransferase with HDIG domain
MGQTITTHAGAHDVSSESAIQVSVDDDKQQRLKRITQSIIGLPTLPTVITQLISLIDNPKTSARNVAQLISTDQALTAKILKLANSAFYGFPREIATVDLAVVVLGFETVKNLGLSVSVLERFAGADGDSGEFDRQKFWEHSIACGVAARLLATKLRYRVPGEAFAAGILHDIGRLILSQYFPDEFDQVLAVMREENLYIGEAEERILGVTHADVGGWLAERWNLPRQLEETIASHHAPGRLGRGNDLPSLIHLADFLCRREKIGDGGGERLPKLDPAALRTFGIHEEPRAALKRIFGYGEELQREMETADAFTNLVREEETKADGAAAEDDESQADPSPADQAGGEDIADEGTATAAGDDDA